MAEKRAKPSEVWCSSPICTWENLDGNVPDDGDCPLCGCVVVVQYPTREEIRRALGLGKGRLTDKQKRANVAERLLSLTEENNRLRVAEAEAMALVLQHESVIDRLRSALERATRERDESFNLNERANRVFVPGLLERDNMWGLEAREWRDDFKALLEKMSKP